MKEDETLEEFSERVKNELSKFNIVFQDNIPTMLTGTIFD